MNTEEKIHLIDTFYSAFQKLDYQTMNACYHDNAEFEDALFTLRDNEIKAMWHFLCSRAQGFSLSFELQVNQDKVQAHWEPIYNFSKTGRRVHNVIDAHFEFAEGKIIKHRDSFDFARWSRQALGWPAVFLGQTKWFRQKVQAQAAADLKRFMEKHLEYQASQKRESASQPA